MASLANQSKCYEVSPTWSERGGTGGVIGGPVATPTAAVRAAPLVVGVGLQKGGLILQRVKYSIRRKVIQSGTYTCHSLLRPIRGAHTFLRINLRLL